MRIRISILFAPALLTFSGCAPQGGTSSVDIAAEEAAVRAVSANWLGFDEEQDAAGVAGLFAPDGTIVWEERQPIAGPEAVEAFMAEEFAFAPGSEGSFGPDRFDIAASGDLAVEHGAWENSGEVGRYMTLYRKIGGDWKVAADMSMGTTPNGGAPAWASELLTEWYEAFNARDAQRLADTYSADARIRDAQGREAIIARFESEWAETDDVCSGGFDGFEMVGPVAVGWGRDTCTVTPAEGEPATTSRSTWLAVYEQQEDGGWLCIRDIGEAVE
jgi:ketosteroid isomerase-like protein